MIKGGTGRCWDPIPVNTWNLIIASKSVVICKRSMLILNSPRLLGFPRFRPCSHSGRHRVEAPIDHAEKVAVDPSTRYGRVVSPLIPRLW